MLILLGVQELLLVVALGFILIPALVIWLIVKAVRRGREGASAGMRRCPHCAEQIQAGAQVCRFCGREVSA